MALQINRAPNMHAREVLDRIDEARALLDAVPTATRKHDSVTALAGAYQAAQEVSHLAYAARRWKDKQPR